MACLIKGCENTTTVTRGLCRRCYSAAQIGIKEGTVHSWEYLEEIGMALPRRVKGQYAARSPFSKQYRAKRDNKPE